MKDTQDTDPQVSNEQVSNDEFFSEFFSPRSWVLSGIGLILFGIVAGYFTTDKVDLKEEWGWYAVGLAALIPGLVFLTCRNRFSKLICFLLAIISLIATEVIFYMLVM